LNANPESPCMLLLKKIQTGRKTHPPWESLGRIPLISGILCF
jgi:hypothetical protein